MMGLLLAFLDRTNVAVIGITACVLTYSRSAGVAYFAAGAVLCTLSVKLLKRAIRQPRPRITGTHQKRTYGMPSTHSASISFFATYIPLSCVYLPVHRTFPSGVSSLRVLSIVFPWASLVLSSRVWLGYHTWSQVAVGALYGVAFAAIWFSFWYGGINEFGRDMEQSVNSFFTQ